MCPECKGSGLGHPVKMPRLCAHPWQLPDQLAVVKAMARRHRPDVILIEDKSTGFSLAQALRRDTDWPRCLIQLEGCDGDKIVRMSRALPVVNDWQIALPSSAMLAGSSWQVWAQTSRAPGRAICAQSCYSSRADDSKTDAISSRSM